MLVGSSGNPIPQGSPTIIAARGGHPNPSDGAVVRVDSYNVIVPGGILLVNRFANFDLDQCALTSPVANYITQYCH
jgi:hypothetical protein